MKEGETRTDPVRPTSSDCLSRAGSAVTAEEGVERVAGGGHVVRIEAGGGIAELDGPP